jgi:hypothetical protein
MDNGSIGRAKTVLVFGDGDTAVAVISAVTAQAKAVKRRTDPTFSGVVRWDAAVCDHVRDVVVPVVDAIADALKAPKVQYDIGVANIGAASAMNVGMTISGFSADVPLVLALLSVRLGMAVPESIVATGHVASRDGDIRFVRQLRAKLSAALTDPSIRSFVYPSVGEDSSVQKMTPRELDEMESAVREASDRIQTVPVIAVDELVARVFPKPALVMASLRNGYFSARANRSRATGTIGKAVNYLRGDPEGRFLRVLEHSLFDRDSATTKELMEAWVDCFVARKTYPSGMGLKLYRLLVSLPPRLRPSEKAGRLLSVSACIALSQFAADGDHEDVEFLYKVASGAKGGTAKPASDGLPAPREKPDAIQELVAHVLGEISQESVTREVLLPIDTARASFVMDSVIIEDFDEFTDTTVAFYAHLLRHMQRLRGSEGTDGLQHDAKTLLEKTFGGEGGDELARAEARSGERGGMRFVLDAVTEQFKREQRELYVGFIVHQTVKRLNWEQKVAFIEELLRRLAPGLPADISPAEPERYARNLDVVVRAYASSMDRVTAVLKTM